MKKYVKPMMESELFTANEYVSACYDYKVQLECAIPGESSSMVGDGTTARKDHGICGNLSNVMDISGSNGFETVNGVADPLRPITNIVIGSPVSGNSGFSTDIGTNSGLTDGTYMATWTSRDNRNGNGTPYYHYGRAHVTSVIQIEDRPNHS